MRLTDCASYNAAYEVCAGRLVLQFRHMLWLCAGNVANCFMQSTMIAWCCAVLMDVRCILQGGLLEERDLGVLMAVVTLLLGIVSRSYEGAVPLRTHFLGPTSF